MDEHGILREVLDYEYNERNALLSLAYGNDSSLRRKVEVLLEKSGNHRESVEALDQSNSEAS
jgi:hypothetical protein